MLPYKIASFSQGWIESNIEPPVEVPGSLALQMKQRALEEEQVSLKKYTDVILIDLTDAYTRPSVIEKRNKLIKNVNELVRKGKNWKSRS